ncbi:MAG: hypothetical protein K2G00_05730 [Duncaniella sp.]|nr:hypothetical protein [Duncaniella sp.]
MFVQIYEGFIFIEGTPIYAHHSPGPCQPEISAVAAAGVKGVIEDGATPNLFLYKSVSIAAYLNQVFYFGNKITQNLGLHFAYHRWFCVFFGKYVTLKASLMVIYRTRSKILSVYTT